MKTMRSVWSLWVALYLNCQSGREGLFTVANKVSAQCVLCPLSRPDSVWFVGFVSSQWIQRIKCYMGFSNMTQVGPDRRQFDDWEYSTKVVFSLGLAPGPLAWLTELAVTDSQQLQQVTLLAHHTGFPGNKLGSVHLRRCVQSPSGHVH